MASNSDRKIVHLYCGPAISENPSVNAQTQTKDSDSSSCSSSSPSSSSSHDEESSKDEWFPCHINGCKQIWAVVLLSKRSKSDKKLTVRLGPKKLDKSECCRRKIEPYQVTQLCPNCQEKVIKGEVTVHRTLVRVQRKKRRLSLI